MIKQQIDILVVVLKIKFPVSVVDTYINHIFRRVSKLNRLINHLIENTEPWPRSANNMVSQPCHKFDSQNGYTLPC